jgi:predicted RNase H-like nuclease (RuvC/YqgF family)
MDPNGGGVIDELFEKCAGAGDDSEVKMLLYVQEKQRISNEIQSLRKKKLELEDLLRDLTEREQRHIEQNMLLKQEINKLERDRSRETENLEYLKNIIFHFMCSDFSGQQQLIIPISTVLHFTPKEV